MQGAKRQCRPGPGAWPPRRKPAPAVGMERGGREIRPAQHQGPRWPRSGLKIRPDYPHPHVKRTKPRWTTAETERRGRPPPCATVPPHTPHRPMKMFQEGEGGGICRGPGRAGHGLHRWAMNLNGGTSGSRPGSPGRSSGRSWGAAGRLERLAKGCPTPHRILGR